MTDARPLSQRLKDDNWQLHQIAERSDGLGGVLKGSLPLDGYVGILEQQWVIAAPMDAALRGALAARPGVAPLVEDDQYLEGYLREDLAHFGRQVTSIKPRPGSARFIEHLTAKADDPLHILGLHYVRLGACNGNRFVARKARATYKLPESGEGTRFLDPFGEAQRPKWVAFKTKLDALDLDAGERDRVFAGTRAMYELIINLPNDERHVPASELLERHEGQLDHGVFTKSHAAVAHHTEPTPGGARLNLTE